MTNAEMKEEVKFTGEYEGAALAKQLFLYDKKNKDRIWLVCAEVDVEIDLKLLQKYLGVGSGNLRAADLDTLWKYLGCKKGLVNYFSIVNDVENKVKMIYDKKLYESKWQSFHPMDNAASTCINVEGVNKIKELTGRDDSNFEFMDFEALKGSAPAAGGGEPKKPKPDKSKQQKKKGGDVVVDADGGENKGKQQGKKLTDEEKK